MKLVGVLISVLGCIVIGFGTKATIIHTSHTSIVQILFGTFILTFGVFFAIVGHLAQKYGRQVGQNRPIFVFDNNSAMTILIPAGIVLICLEGTAFYLFARYWH